MMLELPAENQARKDANFMIHLVSEAWRLSTVNRALGTNLTSLDSLPVDFVEAVLVWGTWKPDA